ncbi:MAG: ABC transporter ATP-binding protein [Alphaproteobacteria bacterium]|nr:ABC transporter ATP-binding protein [Alphaproteobacteria bacterium]
MTMAGTDMAGGQAVQATAPPLLKVTNLEVVYHRAATAVQGVSIKVDQGTITAIVGTNGAGKTTTLAAIAGFMRADDVHITQGDVLFDGIQIKELPNYRISALGISLVPERDKIFKVLSVEDNLAACVPGRGTEGVMSRADVYQLFPALASRRGTVAGYLSGGERQMLAIAMTLLSRPKLIMIDEMSLGLAPVIVAQLQESVRTLRREFGISFLIVEQNAATALEIAEYTYVLENGRVVFDGTRDRLLGHDDFQEFYLGIERGGEQKSYKDIKQYRRKRRWFG